jgi:DNA-binding transcriptional ArsR family regulator
MGAAVHVVQTLDSAAALLSEARLRILEELEQPDSASGVARRIGLPRQQVNYHLRELEKTGLVNFVEERRKGNCVERVVRAAARSYVISPEALGRLGTTEAEQRDRFSIAYFLSLAARVIRDLAAARDRGEREGKRVATLAIETEIRFATAEARSAFAEELTRTMGQLAAKYHSPSGRNFRVIAGAYPAVKHEEKTNAEKV